MSKAVKSFTSAVGSFFGGGNEMFPQIAQVISAPPPPAVAPPTPMPTPDDAAAKAAKRKSIAEMQRRQGRASTILTDTSGSGDTLGG